MANPPIVSESFAVFCEQGSAALALGDILAAGRFLSPVDAMLAACAAPLVPSAPRIFTGYYPKAERTAADALAFRSCLRTPHPRVTAADKALAEAQRWGLAVAS